MPLPYYETVKLPALGLLGDGRDQLESQNSASRATAANPLEAALEQFAAIAEDLKSP